ncbi:hypothetical protein C8Q80DRAFT_1125075 [Daedaleopsis nitida]|nr:hypothetical protein C8Q80DRAFT_1125075 [Daedaleopsis nitida]
MSSARSSSSSSPEPEVVVQKAKKSKTKQSKTQVDDVGSRNEGDNPNWDYKPPEGFVSMKHKVDERDFDWEAINDDDNLELWVIRVPDGLKPKYLEDIKIEAASSHKTTRVGSINRKTTTYDVWSLGDDDTEAVGGDELRSVSCLLPRRRKAGKLYQAPKPIARRLVISAHPTLPTPPRSPSESAAMTHQNPARPSYPKEMLKHRFTPLGSLAPVDDSVKMDVDPTLSSQAPDTKPLKSHKKANDVDGGKKKRRVDADSPKKTKKTKTAT